MRSWTIRHCACLQGTNFNSVDDDDFNVSVGGEICTISGFITPTQVSTHTYTEAILM